MKKVSIRDIARQAGVVPSTVSFVLNGKAKQMRISDKVAERIKALAEETGYSPNRTAVSLRTGKSHILGLIVEDISNVFFATLAKTIEEEAYALGYKIVYCSTENDDKKGSELIRMLSRQQVDGFLITPSNGMRKEVDRLIEERKPVVLMDRYFTDSRIPFIMVDNYGGVKKGLEHLFSRGYRKIGFVSVDLDEIQMKERERAYREILAAHGVEVDEGMILLLDYDQKAEDSINAICKYITERTDLDGIFFGTNYVGVHGLQSVRRCGIRVPEDLALVCFDDHDIFQLFSPAITVVEQPIENIGRTAVQILVKQLENQKHSPGDLQLFLDTRLIERSST